MSLYSKDFQIELLANMAVNAEFFRKVYEFVRIADFSLPACQLVFEALQQYYRTYKRLPDIKTLEFQVMFALENKDGETQTQLAPEEYESLSYVIERISQITPNPEYFSDHLEDYLKTSRIYQVFDQTMNQVRQGHIEDFVSQVNQVHSDIKTIKKKEVVVEPMHGNPSDILDIAEVRRIPTGLTTLDIYTAGGLGQMEMGMVTACPGVGKTTSLINFMVTSVHIGFRSLFLTMELAAARIRHRFQAISAHIDAEWFKKPIAEWPDEMLSRYEFIVNPEKYKYYDYASIADMSKRRFTISDIEQAIIEWREDVARRHLDVSECRCVYVDWLDRINPTDIPNIKSARDDTILVRVAESLGELARRQEVNIWTATQGTRAADGVPNLQMKHTAYGYHKNDPLDISLGLGIARNHEMLGGPGATIGRVSSRAMDLATTCDRDLVFSIMKNRDNPTGSLMFYQGPTLKFWNTKADANQMRKLLKNEKIEAILYGQ